MEPAQPSTWAGRMKRDFRWAPYLFIGLAVCYLLLFTAFPLLTGIDLSFKNSKLLNPSGGKYIGFDNYESLITSGSFMKSVWTTIVYAAVSVVGCVVLGTITAVVINGYIPGRTPIRAILVLPWAVPTVAVTLVFRWIYTDTNGYVENVTQVLGLGEIGWLTDPNFGMTSVVIPTIWKLTPFVMLVVLAALQSVPDELLEATRVDGADRLTAFKSVVLPQIAPTLRVVTLLMTIWSFRRFEIIWLITGGGPVDATTTIVINVYRQAFANGNLGLAAAAGVLGLLLSLIVTVIYFFVENRSTQANRVES